MTGVMKKSRIDRLHRLFCLLTALAVIVAAFLAIGESLRLNFSGTEPRYSVYSAGPALGRVGWASLAAALLAALTALIGRKSSPSQPKGHASVHMLPEKKTDSKGRVRFWRALVAVLALGLIVYGALNGSMADVLKKAVAICTECIGLG